MYIYIYIYIYIYSNINILCNTCSDNDIIINDHEAMSSPHYWLLVSNDHSDHLEYNFQPRHLETAV